MTSEVMTLMPVVTNMADTPFAGGLLVTVAMLLLSYVVVVLTVLSVSAIATSGS